MNKFKNEMNLRLLRGLFYETQGADKSTVLYTLKDEDHEGFPSLYRLYMAISDPTEYQFAIECLDGAQHWEELQECTWFKPYIARWRRELELKIRSKALASILKTAEAGKPEQAYHANKYLLEGGWKPAGALKRGRPTKEAIQAETERMASLEASMTDDYNRVMGKVN